MVDIMINGKKKKKVVITATNLRQEIFTNNILPSCMNALITRIGYQDDNKTLRNFVMFASV